MNIKNDIDILKQIRDTLVNEHDDFSKEFVLHAVVQIQIMNFIVHGVKTIQNYKEII